MIDYISAGWGIGLLLLIPLIRTVWYLDIWTIPVYVYCILSSFSPVYFSYPARFPTRGLQVTIQGREHLLIAIILGFALFMKAGIRKKTIEKGLGYLGLFNLAVTIGFQFVPWGEIPGIAHARLGSVIVPNSAMNAVFNLMLLPFVYALNLPYDFFLVLAVFVLTFWANSSTAVLCLFALCAAVVWNESRLSKRQVKLITGIGAALAILGSIFVAGFFDDGGRFEGYRFFFHGFSPVEWLIGRGPASFQDWSAWKQFVLDYKMKFGFDFWMHSDILQLVWEYGFLSVPLAVAGLYGLVTTAKDEAFAGVMVMLAAAIFYYPFHMPWHLSVFFALCKLTLAEPKKAL